MITRRRFVCIAAASLAPRAAFSQVRWSGHALGAQARISLRADPQQAKPALAAVRAVLDDIDLLFNLYNPRSQLAQLNRDGTLAAPAPAFVDVLRQADDLHRITQRRFDPTVQGLWSALAQGDPPEPARAALGWSRVAMTHDRVTLGPGQSLTLNGIAQGHATDRVTEVLVAHGFDDVLVNIGEFRAPAGDWRVGIADPAEGIVADTRLSRAALATSSPRAMLVGGRPHILAVSPDSAPRWSTVSVKAATAARADGFSTAMTLMPLSAIASLLDSEPDLWSVHLVSENGAYRLLEKRDI